MPSPTKHAVLAPSASKRWLTCTPSARLDERLRQRYGERDSADAAEGTKAHALGELKIRYAVWRADKMTAAKHGAMSPEERKAYQGINAARYKALRKELGDIPEDMERATDTYADVVMERLEAHRGGELFLEQRVSMTDFAPECSGTSDCIIVSNDLLEIIDYKNGRTDGMGHRGVPVSAEGNPQLRLYAVGATLRFWPLYEFEAVRYSIVQPNLDSVSREAMTVTELMDWAGQYVYPRARLAFDGKGEFVPGDHCYYCAAKSVCAARAAEALKVFDYGLQGSGELSDAQILDILPRLDAAEEWIKDIRAYTEDRALHGDRIPGYKLVRGRRPGRNWTDADEAKAQLLRSGYGPEQIEETKLKSVAEMEKVIGKKAFSALLAGLVKQDEGKLRLVPESDPRPEYNSAEAAFSDMVESKPDETENT